MLLAVITLLKTVLLTGVCCSKTQIYKKPDGIRLVGGSRPSEGRVEVYYNGTWGIICGNFHDYNGNEEAQVVCHMMGYNRSEGKSLTNYYRPYFGRSTRPIMMGNIDCNGQEDDISSCMTKDWFEYHCPFLTIVSVSCTRVYDEPTDIRLVEGSRPWEGRVEVYFNGTWGTVCQDDFDKREAQVVCHMLGYNRSEASYYYKAYFGQGNGPIMLDDLKCKGHETDITECMGQNLFINNCYHSKDVGVSCRFDKAEGLRLVEGTRPWEGRVEVYYNGSWGTVCESDFDKREARVVCQMLGYNRSEASYYTNAHFGKGKGPLILSLLKCKGGELDISECMTQNMYAHSYCSTSSSNVGVSCKFNKPDGIRLVGGTRPWEGRVEVYYNGTWGTVCQHYFDKKEAQVVCHMLGYNRSEASYYVRAHFGQGKGPLILSNLECLGEELDISECMTQSLYSGYHCSASYRNVGVSCKFDKPEGIRLVGGTRPWEGRVEVYFNGTWGTVCQDNFYKPEAQVVCHMLGYNRSEASYYPNAHFGEGKGPNIASNLECKGDELDISECMTQNMYAGTHYCHIRSSNFGVSCKFDKPDGIRLVEGTRPWEGRVEVYNNGTWGTVCQDDFHKREAQVVCHMLGYNRSEASYYRNTHFGEGKGPLIMNDLKCKGGELDISECMTLTLYAGSCWSTNVGVSCKFDKPDGIRLVGGTRPWEGRVEVSYNGTWGTVCQHDFDKRAAQVVCHMLGYNRTEASYYRNQHFGEGQGPHIMNDFECKGGELDISECMTQSLYAGFCRNSNVGVSCRFDKPEDIRLVGGSIPSEGRVEVNYNGSWGTVCSYYFDYREAAVVCHMLGYNKYGSKAYRWGHFGQGDGSTMLSNLACLGHEADISQCMTQNLNMNDCFYNKDVGVSCINDTVEDIRLVGGPETWEGRVEVLYNGAWGTVCGERFTIAEAKVVCFMLGYNREEATFYQNAYFGKGNGRVMFDQLSCLGQETDVFQCMGGHIYSTICDHNKDVGVSCVYDKPAGWYQVFEAYSGNGKSVLDSWLDQEESYTLPKTKFTGQSRHLRNPIIERWTSLNIQKVKVELYSGSCLKFWITFNGRYTNITTWFSRRNLIASSLFGLKDQGFESFRIVNMKGFHRLPFVISSLDDHQWFLVYEPDTSSGYFDDADLDENVVPHDQLGPHFRYIKDMQNNDQEYGSGDRMVISILTEN